MRKVMIILGMVILVGLVGCGKNDSEESKGREEARKSEKKSIVGKWKEVDGDQIIEFFKDEIVIIYDVDKDKESGLPGDYKFIDKNQIRMNVALFGPITAEISSSMDEITLTNPFGIVEKYRKLEESVREEKPARFLTATPEKEVPSPKIVFSRGLFQIGDFSVGLSSVERETRKTNLHFLVTKIKEPGLVIEPLAITLTDDHENNYYGTFDLIPYTDFPFPLLPEGFTYVKTASITMPKPAPIETIQIEGFEPVEFKKIKLIKPEPQLDLLKNELKFREFIPIGRFLSFFVESINYEDLFTWVISGHFKNDDYNKLDVIVKCALQDNEGEIVVMEEFERITVPGLSQNVVSLRFKAASKEPRRLLIFCTDVSSEATIFKFWPVDIQSFARETNQHLFALRNQMADKIQERDYLFFGESLSVVQRVIAAIRTIPRHEFVSWKEWEGVYEDRPAAVDRDKWVRSFSMQTFIGQPSFIARIAQLLQIEAEEKVLIITTDFGYLSAIFAEITAPERVFCVMYPPEIVPDVSEVLENTGYGEIKLKAGDISLGWKEHAPFDAIFVGGVFPQIPQDLAHQLNDGGRMIVPIGEVGINRGGLSKLFLVRKSSGEISEKEAPVGSVGFNLMSEIIESSHRTEEESLIRMESVR